ncbi:SDR family NAD(P)-dependent oxidoreductase, partial [Streptomyces sp. NPDC008222]|uniref:SDR family NAD(P)-dependent oxidoreductase n=2 Tax=unclassified Streptomyces TaxID=2593676 RepID=UPI0036F169FB
RCVVVDGDGAAPLERLLRTELSYSAVRDGRRLRPELTPAADPTPDPAPSRLVLTEYGGPEYLRSQPARRRSPQPGEVEIEVRAAGLNFRDVLISLGMMRDHYAGAYGLEHARDIPLGFECAGVVTAVGPGVTQPAVGDAVMAMTEGGFADYVTTSASQVAPLPQGLSMTEGATVPLAFLTAYYALARLASLRPGERVLVHAASGGVGGAAVQIARALGAEVFATAGAGKRDAVRALGVTHVLDSRSTSFAEELLALTGGKGVDVILNSLSGDFIPAGLSALAPGGRFVEMGKLGIWSPDRMRSARPDVGYFPFDLGDDAERDGTLLPGLFEALGELFASGALRPLPMTVFPRRDAARAYAHMQHTRHIGKVVLTFDRPVRLSSDAAYLVTGGLGGLGLVVARRLAAGGAGHVVLAGRGAGEPSAGVRAAVAEMEALGARVHLVVADVSVAGEVERLVDRVCAVGALRGVVHAAGVLDDGVLGAQSGERFGRVFGPKVVGAGELDRVLRARKVPLDFFVAFSSVAALLEDGGQGNYAAANAFLDVLMARRRADGLPGLAVNWGPWAEVGMAAPMADRMARTGTAMIPPEQGADAFMALLGAPVAQIGVMPTVGRDRPRRAGSGDGAEPAPAVRAESWRTRLTQAPAAERSGMLRGYLERQLITLMELPAGYRVDGHTTFSELGMDSLMVVELRNRLQRDLEVSLGSTVAFNHPTVEQLQAHLEEQLGLAPEPGGAAAAAQAPGTADAAEGPDASDSPDALPLDDLRALVDRELDLLLNDDEDATP